MKLVIQLLKIIGAVLVGAVALAIAVGITLWGSVIFAVVTTFAGVMAVLGFVSCIVYEVLFSSKDKSQAP
tara:strand:- start:400 stop:609 length:210 start_codon:yes stop_codon:yes gene_type:complete